MTKNTLAVACGLAVLAGLLTLTPPTSQAGSNSGKASTTLSPAPGLPAGLAAQEHVVQSYAKLPLSFEANRGQTDAQAKFISRGNGYTLFLTGNEAVLALRRPSGKASGGPLQPREARLPFRPSAGVESQAPAVMRMKLVGANPGAKVRGTDELPGKSNYFIGNDPTKWRTNVPSYAKVRYEGVYSGIDLVYYGNQRQLEYDFVVAPGADPKAIVLAVSGSSDGQSAGWMPLRIDAQGDLVVRSDDGEVRFHKPVVYQPGADGRRVSVEGQYALDRKGGVSFEVARYDRSKPLVIDPVLAYSTYLGGSGNNTGGGDVGTGIAVDGAGNIYVAGYTRSTDFPTVNALQGAPGGPPGLNPDWDAFVAKIKADGSALAYSTYLGGGDIDIANGIAVDSAGNAYVAGHTASTNFPTSNALQGASGGGGDAFVAGTDRGHP
ncbi:MAG TPA: SBBP repeat-containing protein [Bryobacteraceae bacterium]|nr:SBBP repeat-containing protein [Bryobacteraceae bacterium]